MAFKPISQLFKPSDGYVCNWNFLNLQIMGAFNDSNPGLGRITVVVVSSWRIWRARIWPRSSFSLPFWIGRPLLASWLASLLAQQILHRRPPLVNTDAEVLMDPVMPQVMGLLEELGYLPLSDHNCHPTQHLHWKVSKEARLRQDISNVIVGNFLNLHVNNCLQTKFLAVILVLWPFFYNF